MTLQDNNQVCWFAMRDLTPSNAKKIAYELLQEEGIEVFTPMKQVVSIKRGKKVVSEVPMLHTLLFVHGTREELDPVVKRINNLQYLFLKTTARGPATVSDDEMRQLMLVSSTSSKVQYYTPEELKADKFKVGNPILINGGGYAGCKGKQLSVRGSRKKYILVELKGYISAAVEINPEHITVL